MGRPPDPQKKANIIASAFRAFGERGFARTTMKHIAVQAGIAPGSIYNYFRHKEALFEATVEQGWEQFLEEIGHAATADRPLRERLATAIDLGFEKLREGLPLLRGMLFEANRRRLLQDKLERLCRALETLLAGGRPSQSGKTMIRLTVFGILFSVALAAPANTDAELEALKSAVRKIVRERLKR